jgi:ABC-type phosphate transport system ATPase subunit
MSDITLAATAADAAAGEAVDPAPLSEKISIRDLQFYYGDTLALKEINLPLYENQVTAFIGPSGCGKSTLLRVLNRMYDLYPNQRAEGEVIFDGPNRTSTSCAPVSAWCFRSRHRFR